jgi:hypothetical protein
MITYVECLVLDPVINLSISPFGPELHNHTRDFSLSADGLSVSQ